MGANKLSWIDRLKNMSKEEIENFTEESIIVYIQEKLKGKYEFDHDKLLEKFRAIKA